MNGKLECDFNIKFSMMRIVYFYSFGKKFLFHLQILGSAFVDLTFTVTGTWK